MSLRDRHNSHMDHLISFNRGAAAATNSSRKVGGFFWYFWILFCLILWAIWYALVPADRNFLPTSDNIALLIVSFIATKAIRNNYTKWIFTAWNVWPIIGFVSLIAVNYAKIGLDYNVDTATSTRYYLCCVIICEISAIALQSIGLATNSSAAKLRNVTPALLKAILLLSPILFVISVVQATGDIPVLSDRNLSELMYEEDYGFFYRFAIYLSVAATFFWVSFNNSPRKSSAIWKYATIAFIVFIMVCSMVSGKRAFAMYAIFAIILFNLSRSISMAKLIRTSIAAFVGILLYLFLAAIRSGQAIGNIVSYWYVPLASIGTEYRDYSYTFANFSRASVLSTGYDWLGSTLSGLLPSFLLSLMGIDKTQVAKLDSARSLAEMFHVDLGIRIGLPGEIWFAYGWGGVFLFIPFGFLIAWASYRTEMADSNITKSLWLTVLSLFGLSILNQSTVTFGALLTLLYLGLLNEFLRITYKSGPPALRPRASQAVK